MTLTLSAIAEREAKPHFGFSKHLLDVDSLSADEIQDLIEPAREYRELRTTGPYKSDILRGASIYTLFFREQHAHQSLVRARGQSAWRRRLSTSPPPPAASTKANRSSIRCSPSTRWGVNALIIRHPHSGSPHFVSRHVNAIVINAGDGAHGHPTQALLDVMTLQDQIGDLQGVKLAIVGDILFSRVARSDIIAFRKMGVEIAVAAPPTLLPFGWSPGPQSLGCADSEVTVCESVEDAVRGADAVMCLRLQLERQSAGLLPDVNEYSRVWGLNRQRLSLAKPNAPVMHPGPMNEGLEISTDIAHGSRSVVETQVENGVAMRMAVLERYCGGARFAL